MPVDAPLLLRAFGLALVIEGMLWFALPHVMREASRRMERLPDEELRIVCGILVASGLLLLFAVRA